MNINDFNARVHKTNDEEMIDDLCLSWLKAKANDYGKDGNIAKELLRLFELLTA